jgi:hypothetical protein
MKKVIFIAIAMIAFVGSSMANDIAENELSLSSSSQTLEKETIYLQTTRGFLLTRCDVIYAETYAIAFEQFNNVDAAEAIAMSAAKTCADLEAKPKGISE